MEERKEQSAGEIPADVRERLERMNEIQSWPFAGRPLTRNERSEFRELGRYIMNRGWKLHHRSLKGCNGRRIGVRWHVLPADHRADSGRFAAEFRMVNMRPEDGKRHCKSDCTTRAMAYCLQGIFTYGEIEHEQYRLAALDNAMGGRRRVRRNTTGVWDRIMVDCGYSWLVMSRQVRRDRLATCLKSVDSAIVSHSGRHVAVIERGTVVDSWDSRRGRCDSILVKAEDVPAVCCILESNGISVRRKIADNH